MMVSVWWSVRALIWLAALAVSLSLPVSEGRNGIVEENAREGSDRWWVKQSNATPIAQGYSTKFSYFAGDTVQFKISSPSVESFQLSIFRLGYYGGKGGRLLSDIPVATVKQPPCLFELSSRMTDCSNWEVSAKWTIPGDAHTGVYVAVPTVQHPTSRTASYGSYIPFVVRQPKGKVRSEILFKTADLTWVAYNKFGNWNVYRGNGSFSPDSRAFKASYDRPWQNRFLPPEGQNSNFLFGSEFAMLFWLEKQGYDVSYASCEDVENMHSDSVLVPEAAPNGETPPSPFKIMLSVGHDEYWTPALKIAYEAARENGVHLAFFSGNEVYWRVLWNEDTHAARHNLQITDKQEIGGEAKSFQNKSVLLDHSTQQAVVLQSRRVIVCRKETINSTAPINADDWTGTFRDPRHRAPEEESLLTGQWFMVNAHRKDALEVTRDDATLRFWRDATFVPDARGQRVERADQGNCSQRVDLKSAAKPEDVVHTTPPGVLGYEWDVFPTGVRPVGLIPLSTTRMYVQKHLVENYGAQYKGSGQATHRLSLYRHISTVPSSPATTSASRSPADQLQNLCSHKTAHESSKPAARKSSLVFGAGTIQWSWALSAWHDGPAMEEDRDLQQATLNLLADMGVLPRTLQSPLAAMACTTSSVALVMPVGGSDTTPPTSSIMHAELKPLPVVGSPGRSLTRGTHAEARRSEETSGARYALRLRGRAEDVGGNVAAVEVSVNGGKTWHLATGRKRWHYVHYFADFSVPTRVHSSAGGAASVAAPYVYREELFKNKIMYELGSKYNNTSMLILSRAVDDSGWMEDVQASTLNSLCLLGSQKPTRAANFTMRNELVRDTVRVSPNAIILRSK